MSRRPPVRYIVLAIVALVAVVAGGVGAWSSSASNPSAKDRIGADPPPALYPAAAILPTQRLVEAQSTEAHRLVSGWLAAHGNHRDDAAFTAWLQKTLPGPPAAAQRNAEVARVVQIGQHRTKAGTTAATWLEAYGKKDLWKLYAHDQAEMLPAKEGDARKADVKAMLKMTKKVADALGLRYRQSAPYVLHPSLRPDHTVHQGQVCPCSYPSRHAAAGAAATTYLGGLEPQRLGQYQWTEGQIDWSRVYMSGHVPSDLRGGALLGDMIGEYFLRTR